MSDQNGHASIHLASGVVTAALLAIGAPLEALAWGHTGHVEISRLAVLALPSEVPDFVRTEEAAWKIGELGAEPDLSKTTGIVTGTGSNGRPTTARTVHDAERDPGHYIDLDENGVVLGGVVSLDAMPASREPYDTAQRTATNTAGQTQYTAGYLFYSIVDGFEQVRKDFGLWRALAKGVETSTDGTDQAWFRRQLALREELTLRDIGYWSHFVADASQPMHVSIHYNGWGDYPNPRGFTTAPIHAPFEGAFVRKFVDFDQVASGDPGACLSRLRLRKSPSASR